MVMIRNTAWKKNNNREIKHTWERYIAIMAIIVLGVSFFSGLKITQTAMVKNLDDYVKEYNMYDYRLISTLGLTQDDIDYFNKMKDITAEGTISMDFIADVDNEGEEKGIVLKAHSITDSINKLNILEGSMPISGDECVLDGQYFSKDMIGRSILVSSENDKDTFEALKYKEYKVVGIGDSPTYINYDRGTTNLANGSVYAFIYLQEEAFDLDYYTEIMISLDEKSEVYSDEYVDIISKYEEPIKEALETRAKFHYDDIVGEANEALEDGQREYDEGYKEYLSKKADANKELDEAWSKLLDAKDEIAKNEEKLIDGKRQIELAEEEYQEALKDYKNGVKKYENEKTNALSTIETNQIDIDKNKKNVVEAMTQIEESGVIIQYLELTDTITQLELALASIDNIDSVEYLTIKEQLEQVRIAITEIEATGVVSQYETLKTSKAELEAGQEELDKGKKEAIVKFEEAAKELEEGKRKLDLAIREIEKNKQEIEDGFVALNEGKVEYEDGLVEYQDGKKEAEDGFAEAEVDLAKAKVKIEDGKKELKDIPKLETFLLNRKHNIGYVNFDNDSSIVDNIAKVLPIFFFLVAVLVCSTTMTRMVDEQRTQIGTLKALGYSNAAITRKYISYSGSAAIIGCVVGFVLGTKFFPMAIWRAYGMLYDFSPIEYVFDINLAVISIIVSLLCSAGVTYFSCKNELAQMPASLIRPKAPMAGKRVLLEGIPFIWKRVSFLYKVSIRNILRYKRRFFMTVAGIAGCTALIVAALGIRDSIKNVANDQYGSIMLYDYDITFKEDQSKKDIEDFNDLYAEELTETVFVSTDKIEVVDGDIIKEINFIATDDPDISKVIGMHIKGETIPYPTLGKVMINNKLAYELGLNVGDNITILINSDETSDVEVGGIFENYVGNYLLMTGETYGEIFGKDPVYKNAYAKTDNEDIYAISALMLKEDSIVNISVTKDVRTMVDNMMISLDSVILLVIACAGALGFVVIYNLNNINITERSREIATLKVIGFYQNETGAYIFRETIALTIIGALSGLGLGKLLHMFIMNEIKVEMVSFKEQIFIVSYLIAFFATLIVTFLVNWMLRKKIDRINMTESLKSVE